MADISPPNPPKGGIRRLSPPFGGPGGLILMTLRINADKKSILKTEREQNFQAGHSRMLLAEIYLYRP